jgi:hypothetical protein
MSYQKLGEYDGRFNTPDRITARQIIGEYIEGQEIVLGSSTAIIRSENFESGVAGFLINGAGNAEFNDVVVRGTIFATAGTLGALTVNGIITLGGGGMIRTAASGARIEISNSAGSQVTWYNSSGVQQGYISAGTGLAVVSGSVVNIVGGSGNLEVASGAVTFGTALVALSTQQIRGAPGNASVPGYAFNTASNTGMYLSSTNVAFSTGGTGRFIIGSGFCGPVSDNALASGSSGNRWTAVWAVNGTIQTSDRRAKKKIRRLKPGLAAVKQLRPVTFEMKQGDGREHWGLIAQEARQVVGNVGPVYDPEVEGAHLSMAYHELIPLLINAIQELAQDVTRLKREVRRLESR